MGESPSGGSSPRRPCRTPWPRNPVWSGCHTTWHCSTACIRTLACQWAALNLQLEGSSEPGCGSGCADPALCWHHGTHFDEAMWQCYACGKHIPRAVRSADGRRRIVVDPQGARRGRERTARSGLSYRTGCQFGSSALSGSSPFRVRSHARRSSSGLPSTCACVRACVCVSTAKLASIATAVELCRRPLADLSAEPFVAVWSLRCNVVHCVAN